MIENVQPHCSSITIHCPISCENDRIPPAIHCLRKYLYHQTQAEAVVALQQASYSKWKPKFVYRTHLPASLILHFRDLGLLLNQVKVIFIPFWCHKRRGLSDRLVHDHLQLGKLLAIFRALLVELFTDLLPFL